MSKLAKGLLTLLIGRERFSVKEWKRSQHSSNQTRRMWRESDSNESTGIATERDERSMSDCVSANASLCSSVPTKAARSARRST